MLQDRPLIGILGGMGPLATADFLAQIVRLTDARNDQDHHRCLTYTNPHLPDRSTAIMGRGASPLPGLLGGLRLLDGCGVDVIAIPCNTAHFWLDDLRAATGTPILSIVDAVASDLRRRGLGSGRIGILGTPGTMKSGVYERGFAGTHFEPIALAECDSRLWVEPAIRAVKAGRIDEARPALERAIEQLERAAVSAVVLGCTELPLAMPDAASRGGTPLVDSTRALAAACVRWAEARAPGAAVQHRHLEAA